VHPTQPRASAQQASPTSGHRTKLYFLVHDTPVTKPGWAGEVDTKICAKCCQQTPTAKPPRCVFVAEVYGTTPFWAESRPTATWCVLRMAVAATSLTPSTTHKPFDVRQDPTVPVHCNVWTKLDWLFTIYGQQVSEAENTEAVLRGSCTF